MTYNTADDWRIDPFLGTLFPVTRSETYEVQAFPNFGGRIGIQTDFGILFETPSSVVIAGFTETSFANAPSATQFRVDYDNIREDGTIIEAIKYKNTGFIEFNASQLGNSVTVDYRGTGRIVSGRNLAVFIADETIPGDLQITGNVTIGGTGSGTGEGNLVVDNDTVIGGDLSVIGNSGFTGNVEIDGLLIAPGSQDLGIDSPIDMNNNIISGLPSPSVNDDAANKGYVDGAISTAIANATSGASVGAVGTYALLLNLSASPFAAGNTTTGSNLSYTSADGSGGGGSPSGTWRCMGTSAASGGANASTTLWLRIS